MFTISLIEVPKEENTEHERKDNDIENHTKYQAG